MLDYCKSEALLPLGKCCCVGKSISHNVCAYKLSGEHSFTCARLSTLTHVSAQMFLCETEMF